ncbi:MAG: thiopurine S-methyltransferase [Lentilitoribacter sp.]
MEADFWHKKWELNEIGFHKTHANPLLVKNLDQLGLNEGDRIFLPLCGKTLDIDWLLQQDFQVVGAELSALAIEQLFEQLELTPQVELVGELKHFSAQNIDIFVGDIFAINQQMMGRIDAIFDRAALVALPSEMRIQYAKHLIDITNNAPQILITFEYDTKGVSGPPHAISENEITTHYGAYYQLKTLECENLRGGIKGKSEAIERVWLLSKPD